MSISIISNFNLNQNVPLDYRIVAVNSAAKDAISYKYDGMKVFQQDTRLTYTWNSSTSTWTGDFTSLTNGYIPMFQSPGLTDSSIYEDLTGVYFQTGNIYAGIHNTGGTQSYSHPSISSGTYVPVIGSSSNCVLSAPTGTWNRVGNVVTVSGNVYIDPVSTGTTYFFLSLPVDVVLSGKDSYKLNGIGKFALTGGQGDSCPIVGSTDNTSNAYFDFYATQTNKLMMSYIYQYSMSDIDK